MSAVHPVSTAAVRALILLVASGSGANAADYRSPGLGPQQLWERLGTEQAPLVVDVRKPVEYGVAHIPGAINIPLAEVEQRLHEFNHPNGVLIYCINGSRTRKAEAILLEANVSDVYHLKGTFTAWIQAKLPIEKGGASKQRW